jgi:hypothetical protein
MHQRVVVRKLRATWDCRFAGSETGILDTVRTSPVNGGHVARQPANTSAGSAGAVAQLGERRNRTAEVRGSNPLGSTKETIGFPLA